MFSSALRSPYFYNVMLIIHQQGKIMTSIHLRVILKKKTLDILTVRSSLPHTGKNIDVRMSFLNVNKVCCLNSLIVLLMGRLPKLSFNR